MDRVHVVAGILQDGCGRYLICDRPHARTMREFWEFPGGKVQSEEPACNALRRELFEELGVQVDAFEFLQALDHDYEELDVHVDFFVVTSWSGTLSGREGQCLRWVSASELARTRMLPADTPVVNTLCR